MAATTPLHEALNQGISSGCLIDTKIILYTHRDSSGRVCRPKAVYANSHVLKSVPYFEHLLFGKFSESQSKDFKEAIDEEESAEDYGYLSDSDLEDSEYEKPSSSFKNASKPRVHPFGSFPAQGEKTAYEKTEEHVGKGKVVKIPDVAFVTFQAFLMYLYTDAIEFASFGSDANRRSRSAEIVDPSDGKVPRPSPKSIYRLADKYDVPALKTLALNHIRTELGKCDIVEESFSTFASRYAEIRGIYVEQFAHAWVTDTTETIRANFEKKIDSFVEGDLEHATEMLCALWKTANKDGNIGAPSTTQSNPAPVTSPAHWNSVKTALVKSIRTGVFFDRKYWARHSNTGDALRPVYFSSAIMDDKTHQLSKLVKYLEGRDTPVSDLEANANIESDYEEGSPSVLKEKENQSEENRAVFITGSYSAWKSLFFYRCTDTILFAPLKSQGPESRLNYIRENTVATAPPPCSPKSIYVLASILEIQPLCDSAFEDIKSKVSQKNVVDEVFSWVSAIQVKIMEMECELLVKNLKNPETVDLVNDNIGRIADGSSPCSAEALKIGFKKAFDLKKDRPSVKLRCPTSGCAKHTNHVSTSWIGSVYYCNTCYNRGYHDRYFECVSCGFNRTGNDASCKNCGSKFVS